MSEKYEIDSSYTARKKKLRLLRSEGVAFPNNFKKKNSVKDICNIYKYKSFNELKTQQISVSIAGRVLLIRNMGKSTFITICDCSNTIQIYTNNRKLNAICKNIDLGDIVGIHGVLFKTKTNELTVKCNAIHLLTKALRPLPDKFHGLRKLEIKYRKRYLDLITNKKSRDVFHMRSKIVEFIRNFMINEKFMEVETPIIQSVPGGAIAKPFVTHHNAMNIDMYLRIAPELYLKQLIVGGFEKIFEISKNFRNEGISSRHNPEFTALEMYSAYNDYTDMITLIEDLILSLSKRVLGTTYIKYKKHVIKLEKPFSKISMIDAIRLYYPPIRKVNLFSLEDTLKTAENLNIKVDNTCTLDKILLKIFEQTVEDNLIQPTFITDYPIGVSPLARRNDNNKNIADRFEFFIGGLEIGNGFSELNDPEDQSKRFKEQILSSINSESIFYDEDYITALEHGLPPTAGAGIGIDRIVMILTNSKSIKDVILFPMLKPNLVN